MVHGPSSLARAVQAMASKKEYSNRILDQGLGKNQVHRVVVLQSSIFTAMGVRIGTMRRLGMIIWGHDSGQLPRLWGHSGYPRAQTRPQKPLAPDDRSPWNSRKAVTVLLVYKSRRGRLETPRSIPWRIDKHGGLNHRNLSIFTRGPLSS